MPRRRPFSRFPYSIGELGGDEYNFGHPDKPKTHDGEIDGGSDAVTHDRAAHEREPVE